MFVLLLVLSVEAPIIIFRPAGELYREAEQGLQDFTEDSFSFRTVRLSSVSPGKVKRVVEKERPRAVVLMDVKAFLSWQAFKSNDQTRLPVVMLMTLYIDRLSQEATLYGVRYEIPVSSAFAKLRNCMAGSFSKIGVIAPNFLMDWMENQILQARSEGFELVPYFTDDFSRSNLEKCKALFEAEKIEAFWLLNHNRLLQKENLDRLLAWARQRKLHTLSNFERARDVTQMTVTPDPYDMGRTAGELLFELEDEEWAQEKSRILNPRGLRVTYLCTEKIYNEEALYEVDEILNKPKIFILYSGDKTVREIEEKFGFLYSVTVFKDRKKLMKAIKKKDPDYVIASTLRRKGYEKRQVSGDYEIHAARNARYLNIQTVSSIVSDW